MRVKSPKAPALTVLELRTLHFFVLPCQDTPQTGLSQGFYKPTVFPWQAYGTL